MSEQNLDAKIVPQKALPVIDILALRNDAAEDRQAVGRALLGACLARIGQSLFRPLSEEHRTSPLEDRLREEAETQLLRLFGGGGRAAGRRFGGKGQGGFCLALFFMIFQLSKLFNHEKS